MNGILLIFFYLSIIFINKNILFCSSQIIYYNNCLNFFQYYNKNNYWYGVITIPQIWSQKDGYVKLNITASIDALLSSNYVGKLHLIDSANEIIRSVKNGKPIRYKFIFPVLYPLPKIKRIVFNNEKLCDVPPDPGLVTEISLEHTFKLINNKKDKDKEIMQNDDPNSHNEIDKINQIQEDKKTIIKSTKKPFFIDFNPKKTENDNEPFKRHNDICGRPIIPKPLVFNGQKMIRGNFPWLVVIYRRTSLGLEFHCSGTLATQQHIITAAHCIKGINTQEIKSDQLIVYLGKYNLKNWREPSATLVEVKNIFIHPDFGHINLYYSDIAILILSFPITFNQYIRPICFNFDKSIMKINKGIVAGWGLNQNVVADEPHKVIMPIVSQEECLRSKIEFIYFTSNRTFCAGSRNGSGPCNGDSGAGIFVQDKLGRYYLRGVVSMSLQDPLTNGCDLQHYTIFTDIQPFKEWIRYILSKS